MRSHASDLVHWTSWSDDAFARAARDDRPVLLLIGYATCHWCHVMATESFSDPEIAALIDERFVPIVVDREERPDLDQVYLDAASALTGRGLGWPLLVVLTPDRVPVTATSYLPARDGDRGVKRGLLTFLTEVAGQWSEDRERLVGRGAELSRALVSRQGPPPGSPVPLVELETRATDRLVEMEDTEHGGFGRQPKFPRPVTLAWLLDAGARGDERAAGVASRMLDALRHGALRDPLAGGFHRYCVDRAWRVPHYEKMLTDNAQLAQIWAAAGDETLTRETLGFLRAMRTPGGGLASALDADSPGEDGEPEEGAAYVWTADEVRGVLGADADAAITALGLGDTPAAPRLLEPLAPEARRALLLARERRPPPPRDDKVVVAWQGAAISAFARARASDPEAVADARALATVVLGALDPDGRPRRSLDPAAPPAVLDDPAALAVGLLDLFQADADPRWLEAGLAQLDVIDRHFGAPDGGFSRVASDAPELLFRPRANEDGSEPPAAALAADALVTASVLTGDDRWAARARRAWASVATQVAATPASHLGWLGVARRLEEPPLELVVVWPDDADGSELRAAADTVRVPGAVHLAVPASTAQQLGPRVPLLADRDAVEVPTAFVCRAGVCRAPATTPDALRAAVLAATDGAGEASSAAP